MQNAFENKIKKSVDRVTFYMIQCQSRKITNLSDDERSACLSFSG